MSTHPMPDATPSLQQISTLSLPTLPAGMPYLFRALTDEKIDFVELAGILENYPSIAGKLISLANSVWSAPTVEVSSLDSACARLGFGVVRSSSIALAISAPFDVTSCPAFDPEYFWCSALLTADTASKLALAATSAGAPEPSTARAAGLLHNLGLLWLADRVPEAVDRAFAEIEADPELCLRQALTRILQYDQVKAAVRLADAWSLPESLALSMRHYHEPAYRGPQEAVVRTVGVAVELVQSILAEAPCPALENRLAELGIDEHRYDDVYRQLGAQVEKTRDIARVLV